MDKLSRILLGLGVAIIYPVLVIVTVFQVIKLDEKRPEYPTCDYSYSDSDYDGYSQDYDHPYENDCSEKNEEYYNTIDSYDKAEETVNASRSLAILIVGVATIFIAYYIKDVKELSASLSVGASLMVAVSAISLGILSFDKDIEMIAVTAILITFVALTFLLAIVDGTMDLNKPILKKRSDEPKTEEPKTTETTE